MNDWIREYGLEDLRALLRCHGSNTTLTEVKINSEEVKVPVVLHQGLDVEEGDWARPNGQIFNVRDLQDIFMERGLEIVDAEALYNYFLYPFECCLAGVPSVCNYVETHGLVHVSL